jgi:hypothetical protein
MTDHLEKPDNHQGEAVAAEGWAPSLRSSRFVEASGFGPLLDDIYKIRQWWPEPTIMLQKFGIEQAESIIDVNVHGEISFRILRFDCGNESRSSAIA